MLPQGIRPILRGHAADPLAPEAAIERAWLRTEMADRVGCLALRRNRESGTVVGLYLANEAGIESDPRLRYATVCETHDTVVCHERKTDAAYWLRHPKTWCEFCQDPDAQEEAVMVRNLLEREGWKGVPKP
jgi:hypothetical protein